MPHIDFHEIHQKLEHSSVKLLTRKRDTTALLVSFFFFAFKERNKVRYGQSELISLLSDFLFKLENETFERSPKDYLDDWVGEGFLRKFINPVANGQDDYGYELTPDTERTLRWFQELEQSDFIGTESRLLQIFGLMRELALRSSEDKEKRIEALKKEIEQRNIEIKKLESGEIEVWDDTKIQENFNLLDENARRLLSDFRQVEGNFRAINETIKQDIVKNSLSKGKYLDRLFQQIDQQIWEQPQGKSFKAFWELLMNSQLQHEFDEFLEIILALPTLSTVISDNNQMKRLKDDLLDEGGQVQKANNLIVKSIRRFIESNFLHNNKVVMQKIEQVFSLAIETRTKPPTEKNFAFVDGKPETNFLMTKELFQIPRTVAATTQRLTEGTSDEDSEVLFNQLYVDIAQLRQNIQQLLENQFTVSLQTVLSQYPISKGMTEVVAYLKIASDDESAQKAAIFEEIETIAYQHAGQTVVVELPKILFLR